MAKILVIDDDPDIVSSVRTTLESAGHLVVEASTGKDGLAKVETERPDLIVLDVMMETHTEGFNIALKLRNPDPTSKYIKFKNIPILMLTAIHSTTPMQFAKDIDFLPVELFIDKPIDPEDLIQRVNWVLNPERS